MTLITTLLKLDLDMLNGVCTATGGSFLNPMEYIMSILNITLQGVEGVALEQKIIGEDMDKVLKSCNSMADIQSATARTKGSQIRCGGKYYEKV